MPNEEHARPDARGLLPKVGKSEEPAACQVLDDAAAETAADVQQLPSKEQPETAARPNVGSRRVERDSLVEGTGGADKEERGLLSKEHNCRQELLHAKGTNHAAAPPSGKDGPRAVARSSGAAIHKLQRVRPENVEID